MKAISRRNFLKTSTLSGASLVIAFYIPRRVDALLLASNPKPLPSPNAFLKIGPDGSVTVQLAHSEMGQSIWTTLPMLVAEELGCDWSQIRVETAPAAPAYFHTGFGMQLTGGSSTTWSEFDRYRTVGAMAREMLVRAAAARWKVDPGRSSSKPPPNGSSSANQRPGWIRPRKFLGRRSLGWTSSSRAFGQR